MALNVVANSDKRPYNEIRLFGEGDVPVLAEWWKKQRKDGFTPDALSNTGLVYEGGAMGFLYETNSKRCFADYLVVNPSLEKQERELAINIMMDALITLAKLRGYKTLEIMVSRDLLKQRCIDKNFVDLGQVDYLVRPLW